MIGRTLRAVAHLRPAQVAAIAYRRLVPVSAPRLPRGPLVADPAYAADPFCRTAGAYDAAGLTFIGRRVAHDGRIDWKAAALPRLWRYHLHAFEWLRDEALPAGAAYGYVEDWIARNPVGTRDAWEAYPVSRRIGNWIDLFARPDVATRVGDAARTALAGHALWLERNLETHLRANHYLENARALLLASAYFVGPDAARWRRVGERILRRELREQILADGGHVERSPMYHALVLEGLLDLLNVARRNPAAFSSSMAEELRDAAARGLGFLAAIVLPDGGLPLFNDAADGEAQPPARLYEYGIATAAWSGPPALPVVRTLAASGYYAVCDGSDGLIVDCGELGPAYQAGHGHADALAYEYVLDGVRVVADAGVFGYDDDARRRYARSAAAHSTVVVDDAEPCELWGAFRVGRRAHPIGASIAPDGLHGARFSGAHDGFRTLPGRPLVGRTIDYDDGAIAVRDRVSGVGAHRLTSRITLAAGLHARREANGIAICRQNGDPIADLTWHDSPAVDLQPIERFPRFGVAESAWAIVLSAPASTAVEIAYRIRPARGAVAGR